MLTTHPYGLGFSDGRGDDEVFKVCGITKSTVVSEAIV